MVVSGGGLKQPAMIIVGLRRGGGEPYTGQVRVRGFGSWQGSKRMQGSCGQQICTPPFLSKHVSHFSNVTCDGANFYYLAKVRYIYYF